MTAITASSSLLCLQEFIWRFLFQNYGIGTGENVQKWLDEISFDPDTEPEFFDLLRNRGLGGIGIGTICRYTDWKGVTGEEAMGTANCRQNCFSYSRKSCRFSDSSRRGLGDRRRPHRLGPHSTSKGVQFPQIQAALKGQDVKNEIRAQIAVVVRKSVLRLLWW